MDIISGIPRASYSARDYQSIAAELQSFLLATRPDLVTDFNEASLGQALLEMIAIVGELTSFGLDQAALQFFLSSATQIASGMRWAQSVGYTPRAASGATVSVVGYMPTQVLASGGTIPAGSSFAGPDSNFYLPDGATIPASTDPITLTMVEGQPQSGTFPPATLPRYFVTTSQGQVAQNSWSVVISSTTWTQVADVSLETSATNTYQISFNAEGQLIVQFGDGVAGAIPSSTITVNYATTSGSSGNVPALGITGFLTINVTGGGTAAAQFTNPAASTGGTDAETLAELQQNIPAFIRNNGKLTTLQDYNDFPMTISGVALSYADLSFASNTGNAVQVSIWGSTTGIFTSESSTGFQTFTPYTYYSDGSAYVSAVKAGMIPITDVTVLPLVQAPGISYIDLYITVIYTSSFDPNTIQFSITQNVVAVFQEEGDGLSLSLGNVQTAIQAVGGVRFVNIVRLVQEYPTKTPATGTVVFSGNVQPANGDTVAVNDGAQTVIFEFNTGTVDNGHIKVAIGPSPAETMLEFVLVFMFQRLNISAAKTLDATPTAVLTQLTGGAALNLPLVKTGSVIAVTGMSSGSDDLGTVIKDCRAVLNPPPGTDPYPPGAYVPGAPYVGSSAWQAGGQLPYAQLADVPPTAPFMAGIFYSTATISENEIIFPTGIAAGGAPSAVVLRRLFLSFQTG